MSYNPDFENALEAQRSFLTQKARRQTSNSLDRSFGAEDLVQETYLRALRYANDFTPGTNLRALLLQIQYNSNISAHRHASSQPLTVPLEQVTATDRGESPTLNLEAERVGQQISVEDAVEALIQREEILRHIKSLSSTQALLIYLVDFEGVRYKEAAEEIGIPIGTVASRLSRARKSLRRRLTAQN